MQLTATTTSTSLQDLIKAYDATNGTDVLNSIYSRNWTSQGFGVEILRDAADIYVETVLLEASADSRPVTEATPIFAFNIDALDKVFIYGN